MAQLFKENVESHLSNFTCDVAVIREVDKPDGYRAHNLCQHLASLINLLDVVNVLGESVTCRYMC